MSILGLVLYARFEAGYNLVSFITFMKKVSLYG